MSAKTKIIVIRKNQLAFALVILIIALLAAGLLISVIVTQSGNHSKAETDTSASAATSSTSVNSSVPASSDTGTSDSSTASIGNSSETTDVSSAVNSSKVSDASSSVSLSEVSDVSSAVDSSEASVSASATSAIYTPGIYTSTVVLNDTSMDVQVVVDANHINSISLVNLDESVETAYPLVQPAIEALAEQIISSQSIENVTYTASNQYTSIVLYTAICDALDKACM